MYLVKNFLNLNLSVFKGRKVFLYNFGPRQLKISQLNNLLCRSISFEGVNYPKNDRILTN
jgi:hypothetical protein